MVYARGVIAERRKRAIPSPVRSFREDPNDEWAMEILDSGPPKSPTELKWWKKLRRMRKKARMAEMLIEANKRLRERVVKNASHEPTELTRHQVSSLAAIGMPRTDIAAFMMMSPVTLEKYYSVEIETGKAMGKAAVLETFHSIATDRDHPGAVPAGKKFLESQEEGLKEVKRNETAKMDDGPPIIDSRALSVEEREQLRLLMEKMVEPQVEYSPQEESHDGT